MHFDQALNSRSKEERHWAAFTVNFAARSAAFAPFASRAVERLKGQLEGDGNSACYNLWQLELPWLKGEIYLSGFPIGDGFVVIFEGVWGCQSTGPSLRESPQDQKVVWGSHRWPKVWRTSNIIREGLPTQVKLLLWFSCAWDIPQLALTLGAAGPFAWKHFHLRPSKTVVFCHWW